MTDNKIIEAVAWAIASAAEHPNTLEIMWKVEGWADWYRVQAQAAIAAYEQAVKQDSVLVGARIPHKGKVK